MGKRAFTWAVVIISALCILSAGRAYGQQTKPRKAAPARQTPQAPAPPVQPQPGAPAVESNYLATGQARYQNGEYEEALADLEKARAQDPQSAPAAFYLGMTFKKMVNFTKAAENLKDAVVLQPPVKEAFVELADAYYAGGRNDEALHALEVAEQIGVEPAQTAFLRGLVLLAKRKYDGARASFEKAKASDPKLAAVADFQIATVYKLQGKESEAMALYQSVAQAEPDSDTGGMAKQQIEAIAVKAGAKRTFHAAGDVSFEYDSNVVLKPDAVVTSISNEKDTAAVVALRTEYAPDLKGPNGLKLQYAFFLKEYQKLSAYDIQAHTIGIVPTRRIGENTLQLQLNGNYTIVNSAGYLKYATVMPMYTFAVGESQYIQASLWYQNKKYIAAPPTPEDDQSGNDAGGGLSWVKRTASANGFVNVKYELDKESTKGANWSYLGHRIGVSSLYPAGDRWNVIGGLEAFLQDYTTAHSLFGEKRNDKTYTASLQGMYSFTPAVDLQLQYRYVKDQSSIDFYGYHKNVIGFGVAGKF